MDSMFSFPSGEGAGGSASSKILPSFAEKENDFGEMVGQLRGTFIGFLKKSEEQLVEVLNFVNTVSGYFFTLQ